MRTVLVSGAYQSGKDTFSNMLANIAIDRGLRPLRIAFADWVKDSAKRYYDYDGSKTEIGRAFMQNYATDTVRAVDPTYWAEVVARLIKAVEVDFDVAIISDFRFPNEAEVVMNYNGDNNVVSVKIEREVVDEAGRHHISENSLTDYAFNYIIDNNGDLNQLHESAESIAAEFDF